MLVFGDMELNSFDIKLDNESVRSRNQIKSLGIIIERELRFSDHITFLLKKTYSKLKLLFTCRHLFYRQTKTLLCESLVLPHFNYQLWLSIWSMLNGCRCWESPEGAKLLHTIYVWHHNINIRRKNSLIVPRLYTTLFCRSFFFNVALSITGLARSRVLLRVYIKYFRNIYLNNSCILSRLQWLSLWASRLSVKLYLFFIIIFQFTELWGVSCVGIKIFFVKTRFWNSWRC